MQLSTSESEKFFELYRPILLYIGKQKGLIPKNAKTDEVFNRNFTEIIKIRDAFYAENGLLLKQFIKTNPLNFDQEQLNIVKGFTDYIHSKFYLCKYLKSYAVFLNNDYAFGVKALHDPFEVIIGQQLPIPVETVLLPYKNQIIYDGLLGVQNLYFGGNIKKSINQQYNETKAKYGIITSLPIKVEKEDFSDRDMLEIYMKSYSSADANWDKITHIFNKKEVGIEHFYNHLLGKLKAKDAKKELKELEIKGHHFAIYKDTIIASAKKRSDLDKQLANMIKAEDMDSLYIFKY